jgi:hypothetical protein
MLNFYTLAQLQCTSVLLEAALKEYTADWLKNTESVVRDETGRFAKKAASVGQGASQVKESIEKAIKDPKEAKRKVSSELLKLTAKGLDKLVTKYPKFTDELLNKMFGLDAQKARDRLADIYGEINPGLPNAIRPDPLPEPVKATLKDILKQALAHQDKPKELTKDLQKAFELVGDNYNQLIDDLNNVESESEAIKLLGKLAAASIPISAYLAATLTPEIAVGLLVGDTLGTILTSAAATQAVSFAANKAMDNMDVDNPWVRIGIDLAIGVGVGGAVSAGAKQLEKKAILKAAEAKKAAEIAEAEAKAAKEAEEAARAASEAKAAKEAEEAARGLLRLKPLRRLKRQLEWLLRLKPRQ